MTAMDEYIDQLLAEFQTPEPVRGVVHNILDEPIPDRVKRRLLRPLLSAAESSPLPSPPPRPNRVKKERKRKAILKEFDPYPPSKPFQTIQDYQKEILDLFNDVDGTVDEKTGDLVFRRCRWVIGNFLRGWQMDVPQGHPLGADPKAFLEGVHPNSARSSRKKSRISRGLSSSLV